MNANQTAEEHRLMLEYELVVAKEEPKTKGR